MSASLARADALAAAEPLIAAGVALHWLRPRGKAPYHDNWAERPVHALDSLRAEYRDGNNLGLRPGEPSWTPNGYLHIIDLDIRDPEHGVEARAALSKLLPGWSTMPTVISGSGGESRHVYFFTAAPLRSQNLARSDGYRMVHDPAKGREVKKRHWEIDLIGTGKQAVIPPSIHPDTGLPYRWERDLDLFFVENGLYDQVDASALGARPRDDFDLLDGDDDEADLEAILRKAPLGLTEEEIDKTLRDLPAHWVEDRDLWYQAGMALHHEYQGADAGREKWFEWSKASEKFDARDAARVWRSFKGRAAAPVRMATLLQAAGEHRVAQVLDDLEIEPQLPATVDDLDALLGPDPDDVDDLLGPIDKPEPVDPGVNPDKNWTRLLAISEDGEVKICLHNIQVIVRNDARIYGRLGYNLLQQAKVFVREPARLRKKARDEKPVLQLEGPIWRLDEPGHAINGKRWNDDHENGLRAVLEAPKSQGGYAIKVSDRDLRAAVANVANDHIFHPIRDRLRSLVWDGKPRATSLFIDYLGVQDTPYHRETARLMLLGAVARAFNPGCKFDHVVILEGSQGAGKSTFIRILGLDWAGELAVDFKDNNRIIEALQGSWILEIPELQGFTKADTTLLKAVITRTHDKGRLAWEKNVREYPRQCIIIGSTNEDEYLRDVTGGRRFWPVKVASGQIDTGRLRGEIEQIWAEVVVWYDEMRAKQPRGDLPLFITDREAADAARDMQESRRTETPEELLASQIRTALDEPKSTDLDGHSTERTVTCLKEVWIDMLGRDPKELDSQVMTRLLGRAMRLTGWIQAGTMKHPRYGVAKSFRRSS